MIFLPGLRKQTLCIVFVVFVVFAGYVWADHSSPGEFASSQIDFPDLRDAARQNRNIPIKVHLPRGDGPFPVVLVSHGAAGNRDSNFAQARHLASHGYVAICLEHVGSNTDRLKQGGLRLGKVVAAMTRDSDEVLNRPRDVSFAIDQILKWQQTHPELRGKFDMRRIGVMGHSFGAYTVLAICGARPALDWIKPKVGVGRGLGPDCFDKRVKCGVALSPQGPGEPFFLPESYRTIRLPLLGISGDRDRQQGFEPKHRRQAFPLWPKNDRFLLWIDNASHLSFSDATGSRRWNQDPKRNRMAQAREDVQKIARAATLIFFDQYLTGQADVLLKDANLSRYTGGTVDNIELLMR